MKSWFDRSAFGVCVSLLLLPSLPVAGQVAVTTYHNDNYRSGTNTRETVLSVLCLPHHHPSEACHV